MARIKKNPTGAAPFGADTITSFVGGYAFLSPFSASPILWEGEIWKSAEHLFQAQRVHSESQLREIRLAETGRQVHFKVKGWEKGDISPVIDENLRYVMRDIQILKFKQNEELAQRLIRTAPARIQWTDDEAGPVWGVDKSGFGDNVMGEILEYIRAELISGDLVTGENVASLEDTTLRPITSFTGPFAFLADDYPFKFKVDGVVYNSITDGLLALSNVIAAKKKEAAQQFSSHREQQVIEALARGERRAPKMEWDKGETDWDSIYADKRNRLLGDWLALKFSQPVFRDKLISLGRRPIRIKDASSQTSIHFINQIRLDLLGDLIESKPSKSPRKQRKSLGNDIIQWDNVEAEDVVEAMNTGDSNSPTMVERMPLMGIMPPDEVVDPNDLMDSEKRDYIRALKQYRERVQAQLEIVAKKPDPSDFYMQSQDEISLDRLNEVEIFSDEISRLNPRRARNPRSERAPRKSRSARKSRNSR